LREIRKEKGTVMVRLVARPADSSEVDLLAGNEREPLFLRALAGQATLRIDPAPTWTHESLNAALNRDDAKAFESRHFGADAFFGGQWIGSSEV
jgi:hypothetical protein